MHATKEPIHGALQGCSFMLFENAIIRADEQGANIQYPRECLFYVIIVEPSGKEKGSSI